MNQKEKQLNNSPLKEWVILKNKNRLPKRLSLVRNSSEEKKYKKNLPELTASQLEVVVGGLLGDLCLQYVTTKRNYPRLQILQGIQQERYVYFLYFLFFNLCGTPPRYQYHNVIGAWKERVTVHFYTYSLPVFESIHSAFYEGKVKKLPIDLLRQSLTSLGLGHWFMGDGSYDNRDRCYTFSTNCFSREDLELLIGLLE